MRFSRVFYLANDSFLPPFLLLLLVRFHRFFGLSGVFSYKFHSRSLFDFVLSFKPYSAFPSSPASS